MGVTKVWTTSVKIHLNTFKQGCRISRKNVFVRDNELRLKFEENVKFVKKNLEKTKAIKETMVLRWLLLVCTTEKK